MEDNKYKLSVVVPVYNEEENLGELVERISGVLQSIGGETEIICVNDSSEDGSLDLLLKLKEKYSILRVISLRKQCGQSAALSAGFNFARGELIATLDADMQCVPEDIPALISKLGDNDAVCPVRAGRKDTWIKKISSRVGNGVRNFVTGDDIEDTNCPLKLFKREDIMAVPHFKGFHRFFPTLLKLAGCRIIQMPVKHYPRRYGESKYSVLNRLFKGLADVFGVFWLKKNNIALKEIAEER